MSPHADPRSFLRSRRFTARSICAALLVLGAFALPSRALAAQDAPAEAALAPVELASPRATVERYALAIARYRETQSDLDLDVARRCFDARGFAPVEAEYATRRAAEHLIDVLDRVAPIDPRALPDAAGIEGREAFTLELRRASSPELAAHVFAIDFAKDERGAWLFAKSTAERVGDWLALTRGWSPLVQRAGDRPTLAERVRMTVPPRFQQKAIWLEHWQWLGLLALAAIGIFLQPVVSFLFRRLVARFGKQERIRVAPEMLARFERPLTILITAVVFLRGLYLLDLEPGAFSVLYVAGSFVLAIAGVWAAYRLVDVISSFLAERAARTESKFDDMLVPFLRRTLKLIVLLLGGVFLLTRVVDDQQILTVLAGLSIGSLAIGFAAKDSIENLFGTFTVLLDKPFQLGDYVRVEGVEGSVEDVGIRSTRLRTPDDTLITVPNSKFIAALVDNVGARRWRRQRFFVALAYDTPPDRIEAFCQGVRDAIGARQDVRKHDVEVWLNQMSQSSLDVLVQVYMSAPDYRTEVRQRHELFTGVLQLAQRLGIDLALPTQTIRMVREGGDGAPPALEATD